MSVTEPAALRQGDVCVVDFFPHWNYSKTGKSIVGDDIRHLQIEAFPKAARSASDPTRHLAIVCSYDCDLENPRGRHGVMLAPLVPISDHRADYKILRDCGEYSVSEEKEYIFTALAQSPVPNEGLADDEHPLLVAEWSAMTTLGPSKEVIPKLLATKRYEMTEDERLRFRMKLSVFVGRASWAHVDEEDDIPTADIAGGPVGPELIPANASAEPPTDVLPPLEAEPGPAHISAEASVGTQQPVEVAPQDGIPE